MSFSEKRKHATAQHGPAARHQLIFHTADTKPCRNGWPRAQPPFGVGFCQQHSNPASVELPLPTVMWGSSHYPLLRSHPWGCWWLKKVPLGSRLRGGRRGGAWSSFSHRRGCSSGLSAREGRSTSVTGQYHPSVTSHRAGLRTLCKVGPTGTSPSLGLSHSGSQHHGWAPSPPCCMSHEWPLGCRNMTSQILLLEENMHWGIACRGREKAGTPKTCDDPQCRDAAAVTPLLFPFLKLLGQIYPMLQVSCFSTFLAYCNGVLKEGDLWDAVSPVLLSRLLVVKKSFPLVTEIGWSVMLKDRLPKRIRAQKIFSYF